MQKIGATLSGNVIVEMSLQQFEALQQVIAPKEQPNPSPLAAAEAAPPEKKEVGTMALKRKLDHIRNCIRKLKPATLKELIRSVKTVNPFTGAFAEKEIESLLAILAREGLFSIDEEGRLHYDAPGSPPDPNGVAQTLQALAEEKGRRPASAPMPLLSL